MENQQQTQLKNSQRVLVIGDSCQDVYHYGTCERLSPEAPVPILRLTKTEIKPGMCLNVAKNLEGLGLSVDVITQNEIIKKNRYVEEKRLVHLLRMDEEQAKVTKLELKDVEDALRNYSYSAIVISDYNKGFLTHSSCEELVNLIDNKIPIFVDSKKQNLSCFSNCVIKINKVENDAVKSLPSKCDLIVTLGEDGAVWNDRHYPTIKSKLYDVCGAGDTFLAGLTFEFLRTSSLNDAILFANKCASISVTHFGNFILTQDYAT